MSIDSCILQAAKDYMQTVRGHIHYLKTSKYRCVLLKYFIAMTCEAQHGLPIFCLYCGKMAFNYCPCNSQIAIYETS